jgi:hypothetical protein
VQMHMTKRHSLRGSQPFGSRLHEVAWPLLTPLYFSPFPRPSLPSAVAGCLQLPLLLSWVCPTRLVLSVATVLQQVRQSVPSALCCQSHSAMQHMVEQILQLAGRGGIKQAV